MLPEHYIFLKSFKKLSTGTLALTLHENYSKKTY